MDVWGESQFSGIVFNTGGKGRSNAQGGVWKHVRPERPVSGKPQWDRLVLNVPAELLAPGATTQKAGLGGADSQIWLVRAAIETGG